MAIFILSCTSQKQIHIIETSDVHGSGLERVASFIASEREEVGDRLILLDGGDILQGQPSNYYFNYIDTASENIEASVRNYLRYDAVALGNHDVETGHKVYDKWIKESMAPILGANVVKASTKEPYIKPYVILKRYGVKIAILGMLTPAIPNWLDEDLWSGLEFENIVESSRKWLKIIRHKEKPDIVIGLFHSGYEGGIVAANYSENQVREVAEKVAGFDLILYGHDHTPRVESVKNPNNQEVICAGPNSNARSVVKATITVSGHKVKNVSAEIVQMADYKEDTTFVNHFATKREAFADFINEKIGVAPCDVREQECFFGSAPFTDMVHALLLSSTGADISFTAPLSANALIHKGEIRVKEMFDLYRFENKIHLLTMTGKEVKNYLEMSYGLWVNTISTGKDHIMLLKEFIDKKGVKHYGFKNMSYNFDSAAGIDYVVDVTKPVGERVKILRMSNKEAFDENKSYKVALNSYRASGGGELLTKGAKIPQAQLEQRVIYKSSRDLRYYLMRKIKASGTIDTLRLNNWKFIPENLVREAAERDRKLLFEQAE